MFPLPARYVGLYKTHSPSKCQSIKFHWPRHWGHTRRNLGCAADEKSLERKLGETHKKMFKYTSGKDDVLGQMARANQRIVQLKDLLHVAKMRPMTGHDGAKDLEVMASTPARAETELKGKPRNFNPAGNGFELPRSYTPEARAAIMRVAKHGHTRGPLWVAPVKISLGLKMVLEDKQLPAGDPDKVVPVTLRSRARMWGAPRYDDVKVMVEGSPHGSYFAR